MISIDFSSKIDTRRPLLLPIFSGTGTNILRKISLSSGQKQALTRVLRSRFLPRSGMVPIFSNSSPLFIFILGKEKKLTRREIREAGELIFSGLKKYHLENLFIMKGGLSEEWFRAFCEGVVLGSYEFLDFKSKHTLQKKLQSILFEGELNATEIRRLTTIFEAVKLTKDLINTPPMKATPTYVAETAKRVAKRLKKVSLKILGEKELKKLGCGGILAVGQASSEESRLIILQYDGGKKGEAPIALIGKGVTFDTGGLNIKTMMMRTMKQDLAGAATVLGVFQAACELSMPKNIVAVIPTVENAINERAYRPDDILTMYNGKTVEITNTDGEGRLILADALAYTEKQFKPRAMIDVATLTGACLYAVGDDFTAGLANNKKLFSALKQASEEVDEPLWELPLHKRYMKHLKSPVADIVNSNKARFKAGTIEGGLFLQHFVSAKTPWCHLDIASVAFNDSLDMATGRDVRLLLHYLGSDLPAYRLPAGRQG